jgi:hypothetical protein
MTNYAGESECAMQPDSSGHTEAEDPRELKQNATVRDVCPRIVRRNNYDGIDCIKRTKGAYGEYSQ